MSLLSEQIMNLKSAIASHGGHVSNKKMSKEVKDKAKAILFEMRELFDSDEDLEYYVKKNG